MPIQINQKFPRCQLCGKLIPLRAEPRTVTLPDGKALSFCSQECWRDYQQRLEQLEGAPM
jgi:hypothetical protein